MVGGQRSGLAQGMARLRQVGWQDPTLHRTRGIASRLMKHGPLNCHHTRRWHTQPGERSWCHRRRTCGCGGTETLDVLAYALLQAAYLSSVLYALHLSSFILGRLSWARCTGLGPVHLG